LRTHGINNTQVEVYSPEAVAAMETEKGFIIQDKSSGDEQFQDYAGIQFNNQEFVIIPVQK
jgi:hypothetical protein